MFYFYSSCFVLTVYKLAFCVKVDWDTEKDCFETFAAAVAEFYALNPPLLPNPDDKGLNIYPVSKPPTDNGREHHRTIIVTFCTF